MENIRCINCGIGTARMRRNTLESIEIQAVIREWISPRCVNASDHLCNTCWIAANESLPGTSEFSLHSRHRHVCISCGKSLLRVRSHLLSRRSERDTNIYNFISEWINPREVETTSSICHPCWQRADRGRVSNQSSRNATNMAISGPSHHESQSELEIMLPIYSRAADTENRCFVLGCHNQERLSIPMSLRQFLIKQYNYYIPKNNGACSRHLNLESWDLLNHANQNSNHMFTAAQIQDIITLKSHSEVIDFNDIDNMPDHLVHHWIGRSKQQFAEIMTEVPQIAEMKNGRIALAAYLTKLRTGDSFERILSLVQISKRTLTSLVLKVRDILVENYVPLHLGLNHISREEVARRNLLIPNGIFGNINKSKAIIIADGTYVYVQKSSNYLFQKNTYSLHKYRNLVKVFMIVSTDGYIIEILGPYPATSSDANITKNAFRSQNQPLREYFIEGDVFILDRGFRDALPVLYECGYEAHILSTVQQGETQLSTIEANHSRTVTICRWVVEVINGRFKRDFKIFRQEYYNAASSNLMKDFSVAAALTNAFHPRIQDRNDAEEILNIINEKMNNENTLCNVVLTNNLNRRSDFLRINVDSNNVSDFPQLTYSELILVSLGTYQIKQARSYYGEHTRHNGSYSIEVCREVDSSLLRELSVANNTWILRGKIQSRHIGRKIYFVYILVDSSLNGRAAILQHYCNCIVGKRTVGCCAHIMSIIWYLGWARYQFNIQPPAQHLDDLLISSDDDEESN